MLKVALVGDQRVGKSSIVRSFLHLPADEMREEPQKQTNIVAVDFPNGASRQIIFTELQTDELAESHLAVKLDNSFDLVCICFDQPDSLRRFMHEKQQFLQHPVPRLAVYCKADEQPLDRRPLETREFEDFGLRVFAECSSKNSDFSNFCQSIYRVLENPYARLTQRAGSAQRRDRDPDRGEPLRPDLEVPHAHRRRHHGFGIGHLRDQEAQQEVDCF